MFVYKIAKESILYLFILNLQYFDKTREIKYFFILILNLPRINNKYNGSQ